MKDVEIKLKILQLIKKTASPLTYRLDSMLKDHYVEKYKLSERNLTYLIEYCAAARTLIECLDKYISIAIESDFETVFISSEDFMVITHTSKVVEQGYRIQIGHTPMWLQ